MDPIPEGAGPSDNKTPPNEDEGSLNIDDMLVDYASNDIFGDLKQASLLCLFKFENMKTCNKDMMLFLYML